MIGLTEDLRHGGGGRQMVEHYPKSLILLVAMGRLELPTPAL